MNVSLLGKSLALTKAFSAGQVVNNQLNPLYLAIATTGYRIQSNTLHVPEYFGLFSSGPPRLQVHQATVFVVMVIATACSLAIWGWTLVIFRISGVTGMKLIKSGSIMLATTAVYVIAMWVLVCCYRRLKAGYE